MCVLIDTKKMLHMREKADLKSNQEGKALGDYTWIVVVVFLHEPLQVTV